MCQAVPARSILPWKLKRFELDRIAVLLYQLNNAPNCCEQFIFFWVDLM